MKRLILSIAMLAISLVVAACAPSAAPSTGGAMQQAPTPEAMMQASSSSAEMMQQAPTPDVMMPAAAPTSDAMMKMPEQMMSMHFVSSSPKHGETLAKAPDHVTVAFDSALADTSTLSLSKGDMMLDTGKVTIGPDMHSLSLMLPANLDDGSYLVKYKACWTGQSCDNGQFAFQIDSKMGK